MLRKCNTCGHVKWLRAGLYSCQDPNCKAHKGRETRFKRKTIN